MPIVRRYKGILYIIIVSTKGIWSRSRSRMNWLRVFSSKRKTMKYRNALSNHRLMFMIHTRNTNIPKVIKILINTFYRIRIIILKYKTLVNLLIRLVLWKRRNQIKHSKIYNRLVIRIKVWVSISRMISRSRIPNRLIMKSIWILMK